MVFFNVFLIQQPTFSWPSFFPFSQFVPFFSLNNNNKFVVKMSMGCWSGGELRKVVLVGVHWKFDGWFPADFNIHTYIYMFFALFDMRLLIYAPNHHEVSMDRILHRSRADESRDIAHGRVLLATRVTA